MALIRMTLTDVIVGSIATFVAVKIARPVMVQVVRAGFKVKDVAEEGYSKAKTEVTRIAADAKTPRPELGVSAEIAKLQAQVNTLQAQLAKKA